MVKNASISKPKLAEPCIEAVMKQFLKESTVAAKASKADRKGAIELFMNCLNNYGHQILSAQESKDFDYFYDLEGKSHKEFCQIFGPDKIVSNVGEFVGYFLIRKVMMPGDQMAFAAAMVAELCQWLGEKGFLKAAEAKRGFERATRAAQVLPRAEDANRLIWQQAQKCPQDEEDFIEFCHTRIMRIERDLAWLELDDGREVGPVCLPKRAALLLEADWKISTALLKSGGKWYFCEVGNVYPD